MKESVLILASFEKTTDHLFDAAVHSRQVRCTWLAKQTMLNNASGSGSSYVGSGSSNAGVSGVGVRGGFGCGGSSYIGSDSLWK